MIIYVVGKRSKPEFESIDSDFKNEYNKVKGLLQLIRYFSLIVLTAFTSISTKTSRIDKKAEIM